MGDLHCKLFHSHRVLALEATLTLQSEWVMYPFLSVAANANTLCEWTFITSRVCGRGNVFVVSVCVCLSVCLSVWAVTFEAFDIETSFLVWWYILTISRLSLSIKVIGSRSRSSLGKC